MPIRTGMGDEGYTYLSGDRRVIKSSPVIEALGALDELLSVIDLVMFGPGKKKEKETLLRVQDDLFYISSVLAGDPGEGRSPDMLGWIFDEVEKRESASISIRTINGYVKSCGRKSAELNFVRTVVRRCERRMVALNCTGEPLDPGVLGYINALSDLLFLMVVEQQGV
ncbi:MAG: ATP:cob(I)alamin adenosyltransferase [Candidatus Omnitrophica bacterium]|nr:ATP:cob(I)alamin adenosyltransferase [Candidatus Omnitrophota bacterium]MDD5488880.1 ATP:cob(I)alamin adenosyltransferase [Candidatus Omnitrophota bacterium]